MSKFIKALVAKLNNGKLVWLEDYDGQVTLTIAYESPFGDLLAKRWWPFNIHVCNLLPNGEVKNGSYVKRWKYAD